MAQYCINIPDEHIDRVISGVANQYGYQDTIDNPDFNELQDEGEDNPRLLPNPETIGQFVNGVVRDFLTNNVKAWESKQAAEVARVAAIEAVDIDITNPAS
jgi:hypothetical protein